MHKKSFFISNKILLGLVFILILFSSCVSYKTKRFHKKQASSILIKLENSDHFVGFSLFDPLSNETLISYNDSMLFTPASNTKLITFLSALNILGDSINILKYKEYGKDSLIFTGTGYPLYFNSEVGNDSSIGDFLKIDNRKLFYCETNFQSERYGSGWAWDDAGYYYQRHISPLPLYANAIKMKNNNEGTIMLPTSLSKHINVVRDANSSHSYDGNVHHISIGDRDFERYLPYPTSIEKTKELLQEISNKTIDYCPEDSVVFDKSITRLMNDSLYIRLLHQSDNFIAEQLLIMCSDKVFDTMNISKVITYTIDSLFYTSKNEIRWVDGSGLSRYNLMSPAFFVEVLKQIHNKIGMERIKILFPTISLDNVSNSGYVVNDEKEKSNVVYAKTGTLSNNHNLSGYMITKKGRLLMFSYMNNHYMGGSVPIKKEMVGLLNQVWETY